MLALIWDAPPSECVVGVSDRFVNCFVQWLQSLLDALELNSRSALMNRLLKVILKVKFLGWRTKVIRFEMEFGFGCMEAQTLGCK